MRQFCIKLCSVVYHCMRIYHNTQSAGVDRSCLGYNGFHQGSRLLSWVPAPLPYFVHDCFDAESRSLFAARVASRLSILLDISSTETGFSQFEMAHGFLGALRLTLGKYLTRHSSKLVGQSIQQVVELLCQLCTSIIRRL